MNNCWFYLIHVLCLAAGIGALAWLERRRTPWPLQACAAVAMSTAMAVFIFRITEPPTLYNDYYKAYDPAARALLQDDGVAGLAALMRDGAGGFVNLPVLAYLFTPLALLPPDMAGHLFLALGILATIATWWLLVRLTRMERCKACLLLFLFAACGPLHNSLREGNTTHFVLLLLVTGLTLLRKQRDYAAGAVIGLAALIKLPLLLLGVYFALSGRWRAALGGGLVCAAAVLLSIGIFGWDLHVFWHQHSIKPFTENPLASFNAQSVQAFMARLQHGALYLCNWLPHPVHPLVRLATSAAVASLAGGVALCLVLARLRRRSLPVTEAAEADARDLEFCAVMLLATMISSVSWSHYYLWLMLPAAWFLAARPAALAGNALRVIGWTAIVLALLPVLNIDLPRSWFSSLHARLLVSHYFIAAAVLLALLLVALWRPLVHPPDHRAP